MPLSFRLEPMNSTFRSRLRAGETLFGTMVTLPCSATAEILAHVGFDWLFIDGEHGPLDMTDIMSILQVVGDRAAGIVRVPTLDEASIKRVLDIGAAGVIVPQVNTVEQAEDAVRFARYAPEGERGVGLGRAHGYGMRFEEYLKTANEQITVIVQAEHATAVENIDAIAKVPGVDAVLLGPYDLSASLGKMGMIHDPVVTGAIDRITSACRSAGVPTGYFGATAKTVQPYIEQGHTLIVASVDTLLIGGAATALLEELR